MGMSMFSQKEPNFKNYLKGMKMKKIIYLFALFLCVQIVLAQQDSSYLPLAVGNYWKLGTSTVKMEWKVIGDTIFKNRVKYFIIQGEFIEYVRKADNGDIITYFPKCDSEFVRYPFSFPFHQYYSGYHYEFPRYNSDDCGKSPEWAESTQSGDQIWMSSTCCDWRFKKTVGLIGYFDGWNHYFILEYHLNQPSLKIESISRVSDNFLLFQNYPNPFNPSTKIQYSMPEEGYVTLKVFDMLGREVKTLVSENEKSGNYEVNFDASGIASGIYFYKLQVNNFIESKKMFLMK
jgi:hypothetical protein